MTQEIRKHPTLYMVSHMKDAVIVLVVADSGTDAVQRCIAEGYDWAAGKVQVVRIHKNIKGECEVVDILEIAGGRGNAKNRARQFDGGEQFGTQQPI